MSRRLRRRLAEHASEPHILSAMANQAPFRQTLLRLYRNIRLIHRKKLPYEMRKLGDDFVKAEFKTLKHAKKVEHVKAYIDCMLRFEAISK